MSGRLVLLLLGCIPATLLGSSPLELFSQRVEMRAAAGFHVTPIHATLLSDGRIHVSGFRRESAFEGDEKKFTGLLELPPFDAPTPSEVLLLDHQPSYDFDVLTDGVSALSDSLYCAGHTPLANGELFIAGGTRSLVNLDTFDLQQFGLPYAMRYNPVTDSYRRVAEDFKGAGPLLSPHRWYPTTTRLPDGRVLVTSGLEYLNLVSPNRSIEVYDPDLDSFTLLASHDEAPEAIYNPDYTHVVQLPGRRSGEMLMFGAKGSPVFFSAQDRTFHESSNPRPDSAQTMMTNHGTSTSLLPLRLDDGEWGYSNGSVLMAGGGYNTSHEQSIDVYDPVLDLWLPRTSMPTRRHHPATVLLPDATVLIVGGHDDTGAGSTRNALIVDPADGMDVTIGTAEMGETRGYHATAILLPDGRVFVGGGIDKAAEGKEMTSFRLYYPPYFFNPRPGMYAVEREVKQGEYGLLFWQSESPVAEVAIMGMGSMTHSFDSNQRHVELLQVANYDLGLAPDSGLLWGAIIYQIPTDPSIAPPGDYMLTVLDENRIPAIATVIRVK